VFTVPTNPNPRSAGFNNVDLVRCDEKGLTVARVPKYSPNAVAEHALTLIMALNRRIVHSSNRTRSGDFSLGTFLTGFDLYKKTVGVVGTGKIGRVLCGILKGFGCRVIAFDVKHDEGMKDIGVEYVDLEEIWKQCDVISLHSPLLPETKHMVNKDTIKMMKRGVMLVNTSRGGLVKTDDLIEGLKSGQIGFAGLDVYENESEYFFEDFSERLIDDDLLTRLTSFHNVIVTGMLFWIKL
jgi:D-lactate dehydrogenase